jgi:hypothetical protein
MSDSPALSAGLFSAMDDKDDRCCDMDLKTRLICGAVASGLGVIFAILAIVELVSDDIPLFAILYTLSIVAAVGASFFFAGPKKHIAAFKEVPAHIVSSAVLVLAIVFVFVGAFALKGKGSQTPVTVIAFIVEVVALVFFYLTLYPLAWKAVKGFAGRILSCG